MSVAGNLSGGPRVSQGFWHALACVGLVVLTGGTFSNALRNGFVNFDDRPLVELNEGIRSLKWPAVVRMFTGTHNDTWLPLRALSYAVDYRFWGLDAFGYHLTNVALHAANVLVVYAVLGMLLGRWRLAVLGAAVFAVHPVQVESVTWVSGRRDVLYGFFFLLSLWAFFAYDRGAGRRRWACYGASLLCFVLAMLSKAAGMMLPAVLVLYVLVFEEKGSRNPTRGFLEPFSRRLWACVPHAVVSVGLTVVHLLVAEQAGVIKPLAFGRRLASLPWIFGTYWRLLFFPVHLATPHAMPPLEWSQVGLIVQSAVALVAVVVVVWWGTPRRELALFCLGWWFLLLLPVSHLIPLSMLVAERYLYVPMVGACAFGAALVGQLASGRWRRALVTVCAGLVLGLLVVATHARNEVWRNSQSFWWDGVSKWPHAPVGRIGLGAAYLEHGRPEKAWAQCLSILSPEGMAASQSQEHWDAIKRGVIRCYDRVGRMLEAEGRPAEALEVYQRAATLFPKRVDVQIRLAEAYERQGMREAARAQAARVRRLYEEWQEQQPAALGELTAKHPWIAEWVRRQGGEGARRERPEGP